jgi:hypothetical protein
MLLEDSKEELTSTNPNLKEVIKKKMMLSPWPSQELLKIAEVHLLTWIDWFNTVYWWN